MRKFILGSILVLMVSSCGNTETQKVTQLDGIKYNYNTATQLAVTMSNLTDWLVDNHSEVL